jgi:hypothetical protein
MKFLLALMAVAVLTVVGDAQSPQTAAPRRRQPPLQRRPVTRSCSSITRPLPTYCESGLVTARIYVQGSHRDGGEVRCTTKRRTCAIVDGAATFVTGGRWWRQGQPPQPVARDRHHRRRDSSVDQGDCHSGRLRWFKQVSSNISYFVVKASSPLRAPADGVPWAAVRVCDAGRKLQRVGCHRP